MATVQREGRGLRAETEGLKMQPRYSLIYVILVRFLFLGLAMFMASVQVRAQIALTSYRDGNTEIYVMDANGWNLRNLTRNPSVDDLPSWSPSGERIEFESRRDGTYEIYVMDADGGNPQRLTRHIAFDCCASWSPSGERIAFGADRDSGNWEIYVMDVDGANLLNLTNNDDANDEWPSWSPDGERIAFGSYGKRRKSDIYVMDVDGGNLQRLTRDAESDYSPDWSRSVFSVSPAGRQPIIWGCLKDRDYNVTLPADDSVSDDGLE